MVRPEIMSISIRAQGARTPLGKIIGVGPQGEAQLHYSHHDVLTVKVDNWKPKSATGSSYDQKLWMVTA